MKNKAKVLIYMNQKRGGGENTTATMEAVIAALPNFNHKILLIDLDEQKNATSILGKTFNTDFRCSIMRCIEKKDIKMGITELSENLHMIAGSKDIKNLINFLEKKYPDTEPNFNEKRTFYFSNLLESVKDEYDFIFINIDSNTDIKVDSAIVCSDYIILMQENQIKTYKGSKGIAYEYIQTLVDDFSYKFQGKILGVLCVLFDSRNDQYNKIIHSNYQTFGKNYTYRTSISKFSRVTDYLYHGIQVVDYHDRRVFATYADIFTETLERISVIEERGIIPKEYVYQKKYMNENKLTSLAKELELNGYIKPK